MSLQQFIGLACGHPKCDMNLWSDERPMRCAADFLPREGSTIVTGRGQETGGQNFIKVGDLLSRLMGTVVSHYTAHQGDGAYSVWLLPLKPGDRY